MALTLYVGSKAVLVVVVAAVSRARACTRELRDAHDPPRSGGHQDDLAKVTPAARVPVLHDDQLVIWDSLAIIELRPRAPPEASCGRPIAHSAPRTRAIAAEMHSGFAALRTHMPMEPRRAQARRRPARPRCSPTSRACTQIWRERLAAGKGPVPVRRVRRGRCDVRAGDRRASSPTRSISTRRLERTSNAMYALPGDEAVARRRGDRAVSGG